MARKRPSQTKPLETVTSSRAMLVYWPWIALAAILIFAAAIRLRMLDFPLERDEGEYAYMGQLMLQGVPPYEIAYNMKFPGTYAAYAVIMGLFGQTAAGIHLGTLLVNAGAIVMVFLIGRRLFDSLAGVLAAAAYAIFTFSQGTLGLAGHATHFVILPALGAVLLAFKLRDGPSAWRSMTAGLLLGLAVLMKQPGVFFVPVVWFYILWTWYCRKPRHLTEILTTTGFFSIGLAIPLIVTGLLLWWAGVFGQFWYWTVVYARSYGSVVPLRYIPDMFALGWRLVSVYDWPLWILAGVGLVILFIRPSTRRLAWFMVFFTSFSFLAVCPGFYFRQHYFILMMPALGLLIGTGVSSLYQMMRRFGEGIAALAVLAICGVTVGYCLWAEQDPLFRLTPEQACRASYSPNPFPEAKEVASYIESHTEPNEVIAVLGSEPEIFFYSHRRSASGYIYMYPLMEAQPNARAMQDDMIRRVEEAKPRYLVVVNVPMSWLANKSSDPRLFEWYEQFQRLYEVVGIVDIGLDGANYRWDAQALGQQPAGRFSVLVTRRK